MFFIVSLGVKTKTLQKKGNLGDKDNVVTEGIAFIFNWKDFSTMLGQNFA